MSSLRRQGSFGRCTIEHSRSRRHISFPRKISVLPPVSKIEDKSPFDRFLVYAARNQSGADRSAPVFNR
jgi:hypothetical protein